MFGMRSNTAPKLTIAQWIRVGDYAIFLHSVHEEYLANSQTVVAHYERPRLLNSQGGDLVWQDSPEDNAGKERVVYLNVEYANPTDTKSIKCGLSQWRVYDKESYGYEPEALSNWLYKDNNKRQLVDSFVNPGLNLRGWVAFIVPKPADIGRVQFMSGHLSGKTADLTITL